MVKRRNSRYNAFAWGAPRRVPIDWTPSPAGPMQVAPLGRIRKKARVVVEQSERSICDLG
jgi:hypothetical protein